MLDVSRTSCFSTLFSFPPPFSVFSKFQWIFISGPGPFFLSSLFSFSFHVRALGHTAAVNPGGLSERAAEAMRGSRTSSRFFFVNLLSNAFSGDEGSKRLRPRVGSFWVVREAAIPI